ncbi:MAG: LysR family transcriptional regulator [Chloroherpetonaceae bacterium]|nr:LysR family transcriptional regulator [Chthonomonadaceae bacterium]MDW8206309.1 LysR family transcriptional regulator [Chloroherpetonaceae bacterium]
MKLSSLSALKLFCDVVETRSFSEAAERNYISQSAASQRLRALERALGQTLLERERGRSGVRPTEAGQILYEGGKHLLYEIAELEARLYGLSDEVAGTLRVATVYSVGLHALPGHLKPFLAAYPRVNVHLEYSQTGKIYQDVLSGAVDVGIVAVPKERAGITVIPFEDEAMVLICAPEHPLARCREIQLAQLEGQAFIGFSGDIPTSGLIEEHLRRAGVRVRTVMTFDNIETIKNLVEIGSGVALVPEGTATKEAREGTLVIVPLAPGDSFRRPTGILIRKAGARRAVVRAFVAALTSGLSRGTPNGEATRMAAPSEAIPSGSLRIAPGGHTRRSE